MVFGRTIQQVLIRAQFLFVCIFLLSGCAPVPQKKAFVSPEKSIQKQPEDRGITILQNMRTQAVSRRVGRWAVVIGISDYKYDTSWDPAKGIPDLKYANRDAKAFADFLLSPIGGAFARDHVRLLLDSQATVENVRVAIGDFLARSLEDDLVIIFFAGHGTPDPKNPKNLYLLSHDTRPGKYYGTALPMWEIDVALSRTIRSKKVFVIADACHSAGVGGTRSTSEAERFNDYMDKLARSKEGVTKITASRSDELSQEREFPEGGHGLFTYYLLKGLKGEGDENSDGFVTMKEAYGYLYDRVRSDSRHSQNPWASAYVSADIPLGIADQQVLAAIKARVKAKKERVPEPIITVQPSPSSIRIPRDSAAAVKLARAKLAKDETNIAIEMIEKILARSDTSEPDALALKIEILLGKNDLKGAEDAEDLLVILFPENPAALRGARLVYDHYIHRLSETSPAQQIQKLDVYLKRHPGGLLEKEVGNKVHTLRLDVKDRYKNRKKKRLVLAEGFIKQNRFDKARNELDSADEAAREAYSVYGITIDTGRVSALRVETETEEQRYRNRMFQEHFASAEKRFLARDYNSGHRLLEQAREYATSAQINKMKELARQYNEPPEVKIVLKKDTIDWETPVQFTFEASDKENDPVSVVSWDFGDGTTAKGEKPAHTYAKWEGDQKERQYTVILKVTDNHTVVSAKKSLIVKKQDRIKTFTIGSATFKMIRIPAGSFMMGSPISEAGRYDDELQHQVMFR